MPDDVATMRDTVVTESESAATETTAVETKATETEIQTPKIVEDVPAEAAELGRILLDAGYSRAQINDLLETPKALNALRYAIENNPDEFMNVLERSNPQAAERLLDANTDRYLKRYGTKEAPAAKGKEDGTSNLEVESLKERLNRMEAERHSERQAAAVAATRQRYEQRVEDLFGLKEVKALGLSRADVRNMKARIDVELGRDPGSAQRASNGNFVDVPKVFQSILDEHVQDRKEAQKAEKDRREAAEKGAYPEFQSGPNPFANFKLPDGASDSWDATESALADALKRTAV